jgi:hypothetical protein
MRGWMMSVVKSSRSWIHLVEAARSWISVRQRKGLLGGVAGEAQWWSVVASASAVLVVALPADGGCSTGPSGGGVDHRLMRRRSKHAHGGGTLMWRRRDVDLASAPGTTRLCRATQYVNSNFKQPTPSRWKLTVTSNSPTSIDGS